MSMSLQHLEVLLELTRTGMGTKLLACLCTIDNQDTYTSILCLCPKSREPVCFSLVSLSVWDSVWSRYTVRW